MPKRLIDVDQLRDLVENQKLQQWRVSEITGIPAKKVTKYCRRYGIVSQRTGPRNGEKHPNWKGGRKIRKGYVYVYTPDHPFATKQLYVAEHRLVMEKKLSRYLLPGEVVHHLDGNSQNNSPDNLVLFGSNAAHLKLELLGRKPNWSPEGYKKMLEAAQRKSTLAKSKRGDGQPPQLPDHLT